MLLSSNPYTDVFSSTIPPILHYGTVQNEQRELLFYRCLRVDTVPLNLNTHNKAVIQDRVQCEAGKLKVFK